MTKTERQASLLEYNHLAVKSSCFFDTFFDLPFCCPPFCFIKKNTRKHIYTPFLLLAKKKKLSFFWRCYKVGIHVNYCLVSIYPTSHVLRMGPFWPFLVNCLTFADFLLLNFVLHYLSNKNKIVWGPLRSFCVRISGYKFDGERRHHTM